MTMRGTALG